MGTTIYADTEIQADRFYGGTDKDVCLQITGKDGFVQLDIDQLKMLIYVIEKQILPFEKTAKE